MLLPHLTDLFRLFLSDGVTPHLWNKVRATPLHKKGPTPFPKNYGLLAINAMVVSIDFLQTWSGTRWLTDWALAEHQLPASQFGFCLIRNTNQPLFILCDTFSLLQKRKKWCSLLSWTSLLPTTVFQERSFGDTCKKVRLHII